LPAQSIGVIELLKSVLQEKAGVVVDDLDGDVADELAEEALVKEAAATMQSVQDQDNQGMLATETDDEGEEQGEPLTSSTGNTPVRLINIELNILSFISIYY
jgi:hypothetical protein